MKKQYSETEIKIKTAAKSLFLEKGYSATTTRDISKSSEINLALLNYYFTSKKKLFEIDIPIHDSPHQKPEHPTGTASRVPGSANPLLAWPRPAWPCLWTA